MFFGSFAWSFVFVSLPFYIQKMSTVDATATLRWTGWILGVSSLVTVVTAPFSARLFGEWHPRRSFIWTQLLQGSGFFLMAVARTLPELFFSRMLLGFMGAVSTFAFIMVGRSGGDVRRGIASIQSGMTLGQVLGTCRGRVRRRSYRLPWLLHRGRLHAVGVRGHGGVGRGGPPGDAGGARAPTDRLGAGGCHGLSPRPRRLRPDLLPHRHPSPGPPAPGRGSRHDLEVGGLLLFVTGAAAAVGSFIAPRLGEIVGDRRTIVWFLVASSVGLAGLAAAPGVLSFGVLRFLQVLCIAPSFHCRWRRSPSGHRGRPSAS
jgi:MFS family permease